MHPILVRFELLGTTRSIYSYGALFVAGAALSIALMVWYSRRRGIAGWDAASVALLSFSSGLAGSLLLDAALSWADLLTGKWRPGLAFFGGLIGGIGGAALAARSFRLPWGDLSDAAAAALPLGHALGRVGCLMGGCCYGARVAEGRWGLIFFQPAAPAYELSRGAHPLHPVQLYEAAGLALLAVILGALVLMGRARGRLLLLYMASYALLRLGSESLRADPQRGILLGLSAAQWIALALLATAATLALRRPATSR